MHMALKLKINKSGDTGPQDGIFSPLRLFLENTGNPAVHGGDLVSAQPYN